MNLTMKFAFIFILMILCYGCTTKTTNTSTEAATESKTSIKPRKKLTPIWQCGAGLENVESVVYDSQNQVLYASNGKGYKEGTDGFISKISLEGKMMELKWLKDLSRPTGMAIQNGKLYIADVNKLVIAHTQTGQVVQKMKSPISNSGLNDVAISTSGEVYITASFIHAVFKLENDELVLWKQDEKSLEYANGIMAINDKVIIGGMNLVAIDEKTVELNPLEMKPKVEDFDGVTLIEKGNYLLTTVGNSGLWYLHSDTAMEQVTSDEEEAYFGDLEYVPDLKMFFIARGNHEEKYYFVGAYALRN